MARKRTYWVQRVASEMKRGALHRQLGIPEGEKIPRTLLEKIRTTKVGRVIENPTKVGKRRIKVTELLKRRAVLALTLESFHHRRRR